MRVRCVWGLAVILFAAAGWGQQPKTLGELLTVNGVPMTAVTWVEATHGLEQSIAAKVGTATVLAYESSADPDKDGTVLRVLRYDAAGGLVQRGAVTLEGECGEGLWGIEEHGGRVEIQTNLNPSAGCVVLLDGRLKEIAQIDAIGVAARMGQQMVLWGSTIHFAPTHAQELLVFDMRTRKTKTVLPLANDRVMLAFSGKLKRALVGVSGCYDANGAWCDPAQFTTEMGKVEADEAHGSFRVQVTLSAEGFPDAVQAKVPDETLSYECNRAGGEWKCAAVAPKG